jgi:hypothetical protein
MSGFTEAQVAMSPHRTPKNRSGLISRWINATRDQSTHQLESRWRGERILERNGSWLATLG